TARAQHNDTASAKTEGPALCRARRVGDTTRGLLHVVDAALTYEFPRRPSGQSQRPRRSATGVTQIRQSAGTASRVGFGGSRRADAEAGAAIVEAVTPARTSSACGRPRGSLRVT